jgi:acyl-CoA reductase-like NAD-dependent aldehyde dehydrogenase
MRGSKRKEASDAGLPDGVVNLITNAPENGLSAAVFSRDLPRALRVAKRLQSGMCHINGATVHDEAQMPFG